MANLQFGWINHVPASPTLISASSANSTMPVQNLSDPRPGKRWRSETDAWGQCDFGGDVSAGVFLLRYPRDTATPGGTVQHLLDENGGTAGTGALTDSGAISLGLAEGYGYHLYTPESEATLRYWRFQYAATGVPVLDTGFAWAGPLWSPKINFAYDPADQWFDFSRRQQSPRSGSLFIEEGPRQRRFAFAFTHMDAADAATMFEMKREVGTSRQLLVIIDPDSPARQTIVGTLSNPSPIRHPQFNIHSTVFEIEETI